MLGLFAFDVAPVSTRCGSKIRTPSGQLILVTSIKIDGEIPDKFNDFCNQNKSRCLVDRNFYATPFPLSPPRILLLINISPRVVHIRSHNLDFITQFVDIWTIFSRIPAPVSIPGCIYLNLKIWSWRIRPLFPHLYGTPMSRQLRY